MQSLSIALSMKLVLKIFIVLPLPLLIIFTVLALKYLQKGILITGITASFLYFFGACEAIIFAFNKYASIFDPYAGSYTFLAVNLSYHWPYYLVLAVLYIATAVAFIIRKGIVEDESKSSVSN